MKELWQVKSKALRVSLPCSLSATSNAQASDFLLLRLPLPVPSSRPDPAPARVQPADLGGSLRLLALCQRPHGDADLRKGGCQRVRVGWGGEGGQEGLGGPPPLFSRHAPPPPEEKGRGAGIRGLRMDNQREG